MNDIFVTLIFMFFAHCGVSFCVGLSRSQQRMITFIVDIFTVQMQLVFCNYVNLRAARYLT